jgi:hypothetical protein
MPQLALPITTSKAHTTPDLDCPFCPGEKEGPYKTYPGKANNSKKLATIMDKPSLLTSEQTNCRPKNGREKRKPAPIYRHKEFGDYSCEAHHAISGNQIMKGQAIEEWILEGKIESDTGYSINNSDNGVWLPSVPEKYKGSWGSLPPDRKLTVAKAPMEAAKGQFHKGPHDITDPEDTYGDYHSTYVKEGQRLLQQLNDNIVKWTGACFLCKKKDPDKGPFHPPYKINAALDSVSGILEAHLIAPAPNWRFFISKVAMLCHKENCKCKLTGIHS